MENDAYTFEIIKLDTGAWSLFLLKNDRFVGGYVGMDFDDLRAAGNNWLASHQNLIH